MKFERAFFKGEIQSAQEFFSRSSRTFAEGNADFTPAPDLEPEMMSVKEQFGHVAHTVEWFLQGAFSPEGFDLNFEEHRNHLRSITSLEQARKHVVSSFEKLLTAIDSRSEAEWNEKIVSGPIMGELPRWHILPAIVEHTAHHRGALTVYARLLGKISPLPYMELS